MDKRVMGEEAQGYWQNVPDTEVQKERYVIQIKPLLLVTAHTLAERWNYRDQEGIALPGRQDSDA